MLTSRIKAHGRAFAHIAAFHPERTALRRDLHAHTEMGFERHDTAQRVVESLPVCGVDAIHTGIGKNGLVAVIHGRERVSGCVEGLHVDMDTLPVTEQNDVAWKSTRPGLMHGCGHDGHTYQTVYSVLVSGHLITALQSHNVHAIDSAVISVCAMQAGDMCAFSVMPGKATLVGTVRTFSPEVQNLVERRIQELCSGVARG